MDLRKRLQIPSRLHRAYLAEPYDGIGQYVLVSMARSSTSSAIKARVAAGDFGGRRTFPEGTPVVVHSLRGQLEVFLGNRPRCVDFDGFNRNVASGLGFSNSPVYEWGKSTGVGFADPSVDGSHAVFEYSSERTHEVYQNWEDAALSPPWKSGTFVFSGRFQLSNLLTTVLDTITFQFVDDTFVNDIDLVFFLNTSFQRVRLSGTSVSIVTNSFTWEAGVYYRFRWEYEKGSYSRVKVWKEGEPIPSSWTAETTDDGTTDFSDGSWLIWTLEQQSATVQTKKFDYITFCP